MVGRTPTEELHRLFREHRFIGIVASGFGDRRGSTRWEEAIGWADIESGEELTLKHRMLAGSITKLLTSTLVLRLVADDLVRLDESANRHLSGLTLASDSVTVRQLLTHTSGVSSQFEHFVDVVPPTASILGHRVEVEFEPGTQHRYSNGGYAVLGELVAHVRGRSFTDVVEREIFEPLGMSSSSIMRAWPSTAPTGYTTVDGAVVAADRKVPSVPPAGGLYTTADDLGRFLRGWAQLLPAPLAAEATSPLVDLGDGRWRGYGWGIIEMNGQRVVGHGGGVLGFRSSLLWNLTTGRASVLLANSENDWTEQFNRTMVQLT